MKYILPVVLFLVFSPETYSMVRTVSNDNTQPAQFNNCTAALAASADGDTLYVYGTLNNYGDLVLNKNVTIIGSGLNTRKEGFYKTYFNVITLPQQDMSNVTLDGIVGARLHVLTSTSAAFTFDHFSIRNCSFTNLSGVNIQCGTVYSNWVIENSIFTSFSLETNTSCNPFAPVISGFIVKNCCILSLSGVNDLLFANCFFGSANSTGTMGNCRNCVFTNCTFYGYNFNQSSATVGNVFQNCLTYLTSSPALNFDLNNWTSGGSGSASNCIINQNPLWISPPDNITYQIAPASQKIVLNPGYQPGSVLINAGTDGTDIGMTGGMTPYNTAAEPKIPVIRHFELSNAVVPVDGTIQIKATATKSQ